VADVQIVAPAFLQASGDWQRDGPGC
jgi:hypothetical protein